MNIKNLIAATLLLGLAGGISTGYAAEATWIGGADHLWGNNANWSPNTNPNNFTTEVIVSQTTGLNSGYAMQLDSSKGIKSLSVNLARFSLVAANTKTLRFSETGGAILFGSAYAAVGSNGFAFSSTSTAHRIYLSAKGDLLLRNDGTGEVGFNYANLQNDNSTTANSTFSFEGQGDWNFGTNSYLGRQTIAANSEFNVAYEVSIHLKGGANAFTGVLTYGATRAAELKDLTVGSGTFKLNNSTVNLSGSASIGAGGTLAGKGTLNGVTRVSGTIAPESGVGELQTGDLTIASGGTLAIGLGRTGGIAGSSRVKANGTVSLESGSNLRLTLASGVDAPEEGDLFFILINGGSVATNGSFTKLNGVDTILEEGSFFEWNSRQWMITYQGNFATGSFTGGHDVALQVIPEPSSFVFLAAGFGVYGLLRRKRLFS